MSASKPQPFGLFERMLAGRYLRAKRQHGGVALISIISVTAISLAVFALIVIMSVMNGFRETLLSRILGVEGHIYVDVRGAPGSVVEQYLKASRETPGVLSAAPIIEDQGLLTVDGRAAGVDVRGVSRADLEALPIIKDNIRPGGSFNGFEGVDAPTVILGDRLAAMLGVREDMGVSLIAPQVSATAFGSVPRRKLFLVGALFNVGMAQYDSARLYMPIEQARIFFNRGDGADVIEIRVRNPDHTDGIMAVLRDRLGPQAYIFDWRARSQGLSDALVVERNVMRLILMVLVAIAALNIVTGLIMLVKNKSRDIAILRTMGLTKGGVMRVFFMASASLGIIGLSIGMTTGVLFCVYIKPVQDFVSAVVGFDIFPGTVYALDSLPAKVEWGEVAMISVFTISVTFISTLITAAWASRFDPVESLRYE